MTIKSQQSTPSRDEALQTLAKWLGPSVGESAKLESDWYTWLTTLYGPWVSVYTQQPGGEVSRITHFGAHQAEFWDWVWSLRPGQKPSPFVASWPRGGAKSTSAELAVAAIAARQIRRYALYISATQEQADDHIQNIAALLETPAFAEHYPAASRRMVDRYGSSKGWRRSRLRASNGFTADAIGLDTAARGVKLEEARPDLIIFDDLDEELDSPAITDKKVLVLTRKLLPSGAADAAVLAIQNLVIPDGIFARLCGFSGAQNADFLQDRIVSGPFPAVFNAIVTQKGGKYRLIGGRPLWEGQNLDKCQQQINEWGYSSWLVEAQQEVDISEGGLFSKVDFPSIRITEDEVPTDLLRTVVWVDPAVTSTDKSDSHGIQADSIGADGIIYRRRSWEGRTTPAEALRKAITWALELQADHVGVETDQGGDVWELAYNNVWAMMVEEKYVTESAQRPNFTAEKAGAGFGPKSARASRMLVDYERNRFRHVIDTELSYQILERALGRFPRRKPFDLVDASFWSWHDLNEGTEVGVGASFDPPTRERAMPPGVRPETTIHADMDRANDGPIGAVNRLWQGHRQPLWRRERSL